MTIPAWLNPVNYIIPITVPDVTYPDTPMVSWPVFTVMILVVAVLVYAAYTAVGNMNDEG